MTKEYLMETAREYISKYPERLNMFLKEYEADEFDFIKRELEYFENTLSDVKDSEASHDGFSITGIDNFLIAYDLCNEIGWEKFMYSTERKIKFLEERKIKFLESKKPAPPQPIDEQKPIKYGAKEYALTYIFDLYATGKQVPINRIEGSFDAKKIKQDVSKFPMYDKAPDTFYRAVKSVLEYDLNKPTDLQNISKDWLNAVRNLSTNWVITERYLKDKNLIGE